MKEMYSTELNLAEIMPCLILYKRSEIKNEEVCEARSELLLLFFTSPRSYRINAFVSVKVVDSCQGFCKVPL